MEIVKGIEMMSLEKVMSFTALIGFIMEYTTW